MTNWLPLVDALRTFLVSEGAALTDTINNVWIRRPASPSGGATA